MPSPQSGKTTRMMTPSVTQPERCVLCRAPVTVWGAALCEVCIKPSLLRSPTACVQAVTAEGGRGVAGSTSGAVGGDRTRDRALKRRLLYH